MEQIFFSPNSYMKRFLGFFILALSSKAPNHVVPPFIRFTFHTSLELYCNLALSITHSKPGKEFESLLRITGAEKPKEVQKFYAYAKLQILKRQSRSWVENREDWTSNISNLLIVFFLRASWNSAKAPLFPILCSKGTFLAKDRTQNAVLIDLLVSEERQNDVFCEGPFVIQSLHWIELSKRCYISAESQC